MGPCNTSDSPVHPAEEKPVQCGKQAPSFPLFSQEFLIYSSTGHPLLGHHIDNNSRNTPNVFKSIKCSILPDLRIHQLFADNWINTSSSGPLPVMLSWFYQNIIRVNLRLRKSKQSKPVFIYMFRVV